MNNIKIAKQLIKLAKQLITQNVTLNDQIFEELKKITIEQYQVFTQVHEGQWISFPINRNAELPDIYVTIKNNKFYCGYNFLNDQKQDYHGAGQESIIGLLEELSIIKQKIDEIVINLKNVQLDKQKEKSKQEQGNEEQDEQSSEDEEDLDLDLDEQQ